MATSQIATLGVKVDPRGAVTGANKAKRAITGIGKAARNVKNRVMSLQGALIGLGAGAILKSIITTASSVESLQVRLKFLTGSTEDAAEAFKVMNEFASKVPFSLEDIERASPLLLTVAKDVDELNGLLEITGDIAAISGLSFEATAGQLQRAMAGGISAADLFRERGVKAFLGFKEGVQYNAEQTKKIIEDMWKDGTTTAKGATKELANTFQGQVSMMQDAWRELKLVIADSGVFEDASKVVKKLTVILKDEKTLENMKKFGESISTIGNALGRMTEKLLALPPWVLEVGLIMAFLGGKKAKFVLLGLIAISETIDSITGAVQNLKKAMEEYSGADADFTAFATEKGLGEIAMLEDAIHNINNLGFDRQDQPFRFPEREQILSLEYYAELVEKLHKDYRKVNTVLSETGIGIDKISNHMDKNSITSINMAENIRKIADEAAKAKERTKEFADSMADNIEDSIMRMTQGLMSFKDVVKSVFQYVAMEMVRANIAKPLAGALSGILTGSTDHGGKGDGGFLGKVFSGLDFATGGRPPVGQASLVGERGAEMFVPDRAGTIVPNNQMGGQTINVTYSPQINALDPRTAQSVIAENAPTIVGVIRQAFNQNGQEVAI